jgi:hypothetical protein
MKALTGSADDEISTLEDSPRSSDGDNSSRPELLSLIFWVIAFRTTAIRLHIPRTTEPYYSYYYPAPTYRPRRPTGPLCIVAAVLAERWPVGE